MEGKMGNWLKLFIAALMLAITFMAGQWVQAQAPTTPPSAIISGGDIGFRVDKQKGNIPVGTLVVRVNGQWVEPEFSLIAKRLTAR
jgi:hypothetical protein